MRKELIRVKSGTDIFPRILFIFLVLLSLDFFDCIPIKSIYNLPVFRQVIGFVLFLICIPELTNNTKCIFRNEFALIILSFVLCSISSYILYSQSFYESLKAITNYIFPLTLYLVAIKFQLSDKFILKVLLFISISMLSICIVQQYTYPFYVFCGRIEQEWQQTLEIRMSLYRFTLHGVWLCVLCLMLLYQQILYSKTKRNNKTWLYVMLVIVFISIVVSLERKVIFSSIASIIIGLVLVKSKFSYSKAFLIVFVIAVFIILPEYLEDLNEQAVDELSDNNFIRYLSIRYYLFDMNNSPLYYAFGAGIPGASRLGRLLDNIEDTYHFWQEDAGIIGYMAKVGLLGLFAYFMVVVKILKYRKYVDNGLIVFLISLLMVCMFKFWGNHPSNVAAFAIYMYLVDCSVKRNRIKLIIKKLQKPK